MQVAGSLCLRALCGVGNVVVVYLRSTVVDRLTVG